MCALVFGRLRFDLCWNAPGWHPPCLAALFPCADVPPEKLFAYHMDLLGEGGKAVSGCTYHAVPALEMRLTARPAGAATPHCSLRSFA